jgi:DNA-binding transcriptional regulator YdaS (Cro superfamily)
VSDAATRTLALAAKTLGGPEALATRLGVEPAALARWMAGEEIPPYDVFLVALDIVAAGPRLDPAARRESARRAQSHADRLQAAANRVRESAERMQSSAELAQAQAELLRKKADRADPQGSSAGQFRQVHPKDGAPASNKPDAAENKKSKG